MVGDHSRQMKTQVCIVVDVGVRRQWISLITNPLNCWAPVPVKFMIGKIWDRPLANIRYIGKIWDGRQKVKIPVRLGFSRHMKTRLYQE